VAAEVVVNTAVSVDLAFLTTLMSQKGRDCSTLFYLVTCLRLYMSIAVGTRGGLGTSMPLSGLEAVCQGTVRGRARGE
jgi:hypothetical protein